MAEQLTVSTLTTEQASNFLMLSNPAELTRIANAGWFKSAGKGTWRLVDVVQGYVRYLRDRASTIGTKDLMAVMGCGKNLITELEKAGVIKRRAKDTWDRDATLRAYIAHLRSLKQTQPSGITMVNMEQFARHIGLSREMVRRLIAENILAPAPDGKLDQDAARLAYLRHLRDRPVRSQAQDELRAAKTREVEMRMSERLHELVEQTAAVEVVEDCTATMLVGLQGLAARVSGRDLALRRRIDDEICRIRKEAADRIQKHAASLRETGQAARMSFSAPANSQGSA